MKPPRRKPLRSAPAQAARARKAGPHSDKRVDPCLAEIECSCFPALGLGDLHDPDCPHYLEPEDD